MNEIQLRRLDMNLFMIFLAVTRHQKLSIAAVELGMTKSAVSHAVGRLREIFEDELFIRRHNGVQLTARARTLAPKIAEIVDMASDALMIERSFDPTHDRRLLRFGTNEYGAVLLGDRLGELVAREAPNMRLQILTVRRAELLEQVRTFKTDVAVSNFFGGVGDLQTEHLYDDEYVVLVREGHRRIGARLTQELYLEADHVQVMGEAEPPVILEASFARLGVDRKVTMTVPLYWAGMAAAAASDRILTAPRHLAAKYARDFKLRLHPMPFGPVPIAISLAFHATTKADPAVSWLRSSIRSVVSELPPLVLAGARRRALSG